MGKGATGNAKPRRWSSRCTTALSLNHRVDEQGVHVCKFIKIAQEVARKAG